MRKNFTETNASIEEDPLDLHYVLDEIVATPTFLLTYMLDRFPTEITRTLNDRYLVRYPDRQKEIFSRLYDLHTLAGDPKVKLIKESPSNLHTDRAHIYHRNQNLDRIFHTMYVDTFNDYVAELSHPILYKVMGHPKIYGDKTKKDDNTMYDDPDHFEYKTHSIILPLLELYIIHGKTPPFLNELNRLQWWRPTDPAQRFLTSGINTKNLTKIGSLMHKLSGKINKK